MCHVGRGTGWARPGGGVERATADHPHPLFPSFLTAGTWGFVFGQVTLQAENRASQILVYLKHQRSERRARTSGSYPVRARTCTCACACARACSRSPAAAGPCSFHVGFRGAGTEPGSSGHQSAFASLADTTALCFSTH